MDAQSDTISESNLNNEQNIQPLKNDPMNTNRSIMTEQFLPNRHNLIDSKVSDFDGSNLNYQKE